MKTGLLLASVATVAFVFASVPASAEDPLDLVHGLMPWMSFECTEDGEDSAEYLDPLHPGTTVYVTALCLGEDVTIDEHLNTDCPSHSYTFWAAPAAAAWTYRYATSNDDGLSQTAVANAWDAANTVWDKEVAKSLFAGHTFGGTGTAVGKGDGVNQVGFKNLGGRTLGIQYAWVSGGKIVETDSGYNTLAAFSIQSDPNKYDLGGVASQEFGHGVGLGHADTQCLTMYGSLGRGDFSKTTLGDGDIMGIRARYP